MRRRFPRALIYYELNVLRAKGVAGLVVVIVVSVAASMFAMLCPTSRHCIYAYNKWTPANSLRSLRHIDHGIDTRIAFSSQGYTLLIKMDENSIKSTTNLRIRLSFACTKTRMKTDDADFGLWFQCH